MAIGNLSLAQNTAPTNGKVGANVTQEYDSRILQDRPGEIRLSPDRISFLVFDSPIDKIAAGKSDIVNIEVADNTVYFQAKVKSGSTDLVITTEDGATTLFSLTIDPKYTSTVRKYIVRTPTMATVPQPTLEAPKFENEGNVTVGNKKVLEALKERKDKTSPDTTLKDTTLSTLTVLAKPDQSTDKDGFYWLPFTSQVIKNNNKTSVYFTINNKGTTDANLDLSSIKVYVGDREIKASVITVDNAKAVLPNNTLDGLITINEKLDKFTLRLKVINAKTGDEGIYERTY